MKTSFPAFRSVTAALLFFCSLTSFSVSAQVITAEAEYEKAYNAKPVDLGNNGIAVVRTEPKVGALITRFDKNGSFLWSKTYTMPGKRSWNCALGHSADGNDMYVLGFANHDFKGGGKNPALIHIDAATGESKDKQYTVENFGHVLSMYANNKYLFVFTTFYEMGDDRIEKSPEPKLYRFDKETMEMKTLSHEMGDGSAKPRVFWQVMRVEDDFVEAYIVNEASQHVAFSIARFDNEGKKIKHSDIAFDLKETFCRQVNSSMPPAPGVSRDIYNQNVISYFFGDGMKYIMVEGMSACYLTYSPETRSYFAYGLCGPGEQVRVATKYTGFFAAKIDSAHKLVSFKEHAKIAEFSSDKNFHIHAPPYSHNISAFLAPAGELMVLASSIDNSYVLTVSQADLSLKKTAKIKQESYAVYGNRMSAFDRFLVERDDVGGKLKKSESISYLATATRQYAVVIGNGYSSSITVHSEALK